MTLDEQRELVAKYQRLREEIDSLYSRVGKIDSDRSEHEYVFCTSWGTRFRSRALLCVYFRARERVART